jgi:hypothetical protein
LTPSPLPSLSPLAHDEKFHNNNHLSGQISAKRMLMNLI